VAAQSGASWAFGDASMPTTTPCTDEPSIIHTPSDLSSHRGRSGIPRLTGVPMETDFRQAHGSQHPTVPRVRTQADRPRSRTAGRAWPCREQAHTGPVVSCGRRVVRRPGRGPSSRCWTVGRTEEPLEVAAKTRDFHRMAEQPWFKEPLGSDWPGGTLRIRLRGGGRVRAFGCRLSARTGRRRGPRGPRPRARSRSARVRLRQAVVACSATRPRWQSTSGEGHSSWRTRRTCVIEGRGGDPWRGPDPWRQSRRPGLV